MKCFAVAPMAIDSKENDFCSIKNFFAILQGILEHLIIMNAKII